MGNSRRTAKSICQAPNPRRKFLGASPNAGGGPPQKEKAQPGGGAKAFLLIARPPGYCEPYRYTGTPGTRSRPAFSKFPVAGSVKKGPVGPTGNPLRAVKRSSSPQ